MAAATAAEPWLPLAAAAAAAAAAAGLIFVLWFSCVYTGWRVQWRAETDDAGRPVLRRRLCQSERAYGRWAWSYQGGNRVGLAACLEGVAVSLDDLRAAARAMEARHPLVRAVLRDWATLECPAEGANGAFKVRHVVRENARSWEAAWEMLESNPARLGEGFFELALVSAETNGGSGGNGACEVVLAGQHLACDASSIQQLMHELLTSLGDRSHVWEPRQLLPPQTTLVLQDCPGLWQCVFRAVQSTIPAILLGIGLTASHGVPVRPGASTRHPGKRCVVGRDCINPEDHSALRRKAKASKVGLNALVSAAAGQAIVELAASSTQSDAGLPVAFSMTVDLRKRYATSAIAPSDISNHSSPMPLVRGNFGAATEAAPALVEAARKIHNKTHAELALERVLPPQLSLMALFALQPSPSPHIGANLVVIGNWGVSPVQTQYGSLQVTALEPLLNVHILNMAYALFCTWNGSLLVRVIGSPRQHAQPQLDQVARRAAHFLRQLAVP